MRFTIVKALIVFGSLALLLGSCDREPIEPPTPLPPPIIDVDTVLTDGSEQYLNFDSDYIFDDSKLHTFELTIPNDALAMINADPAAEEYVEGRLAFEGESISPVGIRYKGSIGAFVGCLSGLNWGNPSGFKTCTKLSMKIKINWMNSDDTFYGLKKLQLHAMNLDDSQMRDRLAYWLFRQMGVPAPRVVHVRLMINGEYNGLFALVEQIDGRFARHNFEDGKGNIYKEVWPLLWNGNPNSSQAFIDALKTNEDENPSVDLMQSFAQEISSASAATQQSVISKWMDVNDILSYAVVDRTIRVDDGPFHWYCGGGDCTNHNYYWYEDPSVKKLHLIPWDMDNTFENIISNQNPVTPIKDGWGEITNDCIPFPFGGFNYYQGSAACDQLTAAWVSFDTEYQALRQAFIDGPLSANIVNPLLSTWSEQIRDATSAATLVHDDAVSVAQWEAALSELRQQLEFARTQ